MAWRVMDCAQDPKAPEWWSWDWQSGLYKESDGTCHPHGPEAERLQQLTPPSPR